MTYGESNGHMIDAVIWPWKVKSWSQYVSGLITVSRQRLEIQTRLQCSSYRIFGINGHWSRGRWHYVTLKEMVVCFLPARRYASAGNSDRNVSVRPSVSRRYFVKTKKASGMISSPSGSPKTLVFWRQISSPNFKGFPRTGASNKGRSEKFSDFYPRDAMLARVIAIATCPSVCLSVCPSRAGIVSKRRKLAAWFLHHLVAPRL